MKQVLRTAAAWRDAQEIWDYIAVDNPAAATQLLRQRNCYDNSMNG